MQTSTDPNFVFILRLSAIGDVLIASKTVLDLLEAGFTPILCTNQSCSDIALAIPRLEYCALLASSGQVSFFKIHVHENSGRKPSLEPISPAQAPWANCHSLSILDLQRTRRSQRFLRTLKKMHSHQTFQVYKVKKRTFVRAAIIAKSLFSRTQRSRALAQCAHSTSRDMRVCDLNHQAACAFANNEILRTHQKIVAHGDCKKILSPEFCSTPYVVLFPGASLPLKAWPEPHFTELAHGILKNTNANIVVIGGKDEIEIGNKICQSLPQNRVRNLAGSLSLGDSLLVIAHASHVVSGDSFPGHACDQLGVPATILFGATSPQFGFAPENPIVQVRWLALGCSPCTRHGKGKCRFKNLLCLKNIPPETVLKDVLISL